MSVKREHEYDDDGHEMIIFYRSCAPWERGEEWAKTGETRPWGDMFTLRFVDGMWHPDYDYGNCGNDAKPAKTALQAYFNVRKEFNAANERAAEMLEAMDQGRYHEEEISNVNHADGSFESHVKFTIDPKN